MAATRAISADKMTTEIDNKIFELSKLIDKNADCLNSKSAWPKDGHVQSSIDV